jgi:hypothetical protein
LYNLTFDDDFYNFKVTEIYDDFKENGTWKYVNFSVTLSDRTEKHFIAKLENGI